MNARICLLALALLSACTTTPSLNYAIPEQPEGASGYVDKQAVTSKKWMVAAANPLATDAGFQVLKAGGSAVDAAIAVQMVLTLVEPQSSGIGGGAFLLHYKPPVSASQAQSGFQESSVQAFDGRETAPAGVDEKLFLQADGKPMPFIDAVVGGRSVGTPGTVKMLEMAHKEHGKLPWGVLFEPAIKLAEEGFQVSPRLNTLLTSEVHLKKDAVAASYFYDASGKPWPVGHQLKNPELASVLREIAAKGSAALHTGEIAQAVVDKVQKHPTNAGKLSIQDMAGYQPKVREAFCSDYRVDAINNTICGFPPPSSGAIAIAQILELSALPKLMDTVPTCARRSHHDPQLIMDPRFTYSPFCHSVALHKYTEASRLAFADRAQYLADPDFVTAPTGSWKSLISPDYLKSRAVLIGEQSMKTAKAGNPSLIKTSYAPMPDQIERGTSHVSIVDGYGNALAMTTTIEDAFGARQMVNRGKGLSGGFLLNNELTDFSFAPTDASGTPIANRVQAGKRPRSSMSPTLVFNKDNAAFIASLGSPGGALIIHYVAKTLSEMLDKGSDPQTAINYPNFGSLNGPTLLEEQRFFPVVTNALKNRNHEIREMPMTSGLQAIMKSADGYIGGADPRREGVVRGE